MSTTAPRTDTAEIASELRVVLGQLMRRLRAEHRFPLSHGIVLARLDREGPQTASELAQAERVRPQSMAQTLADLEADGLITRTPHPTDGRRMLVALTTSGLDTLTADRAHREGWLALAMSEQLTVAQVRALERALPVLRMLADG
jgi:DNA-binding MarR family transcriptional regulator